MSDIQRLKQKLNEWQYHLSGEDANAISSQIGMMLWRSAFYRSVNESRRFLPDGKDGEKLANGSLHELVHDGYVTIHSLTIRRLLDETRGVNSLFNLIRDIITPATVILTVDVHAA